MSATADSFTGRPAELLSELLRFDTSNPPGAERECIAFVEQLLTQAGLETQIHAADADRPNLIARLRGRGEAPPLMLYGHVDVVPADPAQWQEPPFEGRVIDGIVWGRGAVDMKGGVAMMICAILNAVATGQTPRGDVVFVALSDEEAGSDFGARFLAESHPDLFEGVRYALGEFGGYTLHLLGRRFYPIQVAEKQTCRVRATVRGAGGHGSLPRRGQVTAKLAAVLGRLDRQRLPVHVTPVARRMVEELAGGLPAPAGLALRQVLNPRITDLMLGILGTPGQLLDALLHNTAVPTVVQAGSKDNVIPSEATVHLDGRLLPGQRPDEFIAELEAVVGKDAELEVLGYDEGATEVDYGLFGLLADALRGLDQAAIPIPMLLPAITDGRFFARLGIQTYGYTPLRLDSSFSFMDTVHAADERVPVDALEFGAQALSDVLRRYGTD